MHKFTLLINGNDIDTGLYDYLPYASKKFTDFRTTFRILTRLKTGKLTEDSKEVKEFIYAKYCIGTDEINKSAIESAYRASRIFRGFSLDVRRKIMKDIHALLVENKKQIIELFVIEGHPTKLAEWEFEGMEKGVAEQTLDLYKKQMWEEKGIFEDEEIIVARKPDGVICLSPPKNAPASNSFVACGVMQSGNAIIVKPPLKNPISTIYVWKNVVNKAIKKNGGPDGLVNIVLGNSERIMNEWLNSSRVNDIFYFGVSERGLDIGKRAYNSGKKPILELSGNDLFYVWKDANLDKATDAFMDAFLGSTQICMVPKNAIVHEEIYEKFLEQAANKIKNIKPGLPTDPDCYLSPVVNMSQFVDFLDDAIGKGAKVIAGGDRVNLNNIVDKSGPFIQPTLLRIEDEKNAFSMKCVKDENFFPLIPIIKVSGKNEREEDKGKNADDIIFSKMIDICDANEYGLRISVWVKSKDYIEKFSKSINNCGLLRINSRHVGFSLLIATHGGTGKSGGPFGGMNYICEKSSHLQGISIKKG
jgi:acyl-CoA reductase-like NAD-dependent aldehyde dehydrogenase